MREVRTFRSVRDGMLFVDLSCQRPLDHGGMAPGPDRPCRRAEYARHEIDPDPEDVGVTPLDTLLSGREVVGDAPDRRTRPLNLLAEGLGILYR